MIDRQSQVAEWMSRYGGSVGECAQSLGATYKSVQHAWDRIKRRLGAQAA
jgi:DNA-binding CsgD family transcriptional regulator